MKILYSCKDLYYLYQLELLRQNILELHYINLISLERLPYYVMHICFLALFVIPYHSNQ